MTCSHTGTTETHQKHVSHPVCTSTFPCFAISHCLYLFMYMCIYEGDQVLEQIAMVWLLLLHLLFHGTPLMYRNHLFLDHAGERYVIGYWGCSNTGPAHGHVSPQQSAALPASHCPPLLQNAVRTPNLHAHLPFPKSSFLLFDMGLVRWHERSVCQGCPKVGISPASAGAKCRPHSPC